ncbi:PLATZ transcription factor family protein [Faecalicatena contorta]|uniref:PLATZ transcription factor family protein n=1 Tax=Faecalicatena contorta TaxID=39482 RepID=UPI001F3EDC42|nr:PLATZ transcription factor family protein [Faecalicatena contorta]MCF2553805.1 hypothetical protein [Faecalicatena contorta]
MSWLDKMERKFGKYAIPNLMTYIIILYVLGLVLELFAPDFYYEYLSLDVSAILGGQIWRVFTFIIQPPQTSYIFMIFAMYMYYMLGRELEAVWGAFRFNLYFFSGMFFHVVAAFVAYFLTGVFLPLGTWYLNMSLFLAFAAIYPEMQFYLFMVIPVKAKWLGILDGVYFLYTILQAFLPAYGGNPMVGFIYKSNALAAAVSILNFVIFFLGSKRMQPYAPKQMKRKREFQKKVRQAAKPMNYGNGVKHRCAVCGRTELDDPNLEFRYCSKCNGNYEYCQDHLFTHTHVK